MTIDVVIQGWKTIDYQGREWPACDTIHLNAEAKDSYIQRVLQKNPVPPYSKEDKIYQIDDPSYPGTISDKSLIEKLKKEGVLFDY